MSTPNAKKLAEQLERGRVVMRELIEFSFPPTGGGTDLYLHDKHTKAVREAREWFDETKPATVGKPREPIGLLREALAGLDPALNVSLRADIEATLEAHDKAPPWSSENGAGGLIEITLDEASGRS
jgi:hypothetical protein